jgi:hypothetical protein
MLSTRKTKYFKLTTVLYVSKFYHQLIHKRIALKGVLKFTLKQL